MIIQKFILAACVMILAACSDVKQPASQAIAPIDDLIAKTNVRQKLTQRGFKWGTPAFIRIFKEENTLEVWLEREQGEYALFQQYPICTYSGDLGPKKT